MFCHHKVFGMVELSVHVFTWDLVDIRSRQTKALSLDFLRMLHVLSGEGCIILILHHYSSILPLWWYEVTFRYWSVCWFLVDKGWGKERKRRGCHLSPVWMKTFHAYKEQRGCHRCSLIMYPLFGASNSCVNSIVCLDYSSHLYPQDSDHMGTCNIPYQLSQPSFWPPLKCQQQGSFSTCQRPRLVSALIIICSESCSYWEVGIFSQSTVQL